MNYLIASSSFIILFIAILPFLNGITVSPMSGGGLGGLGGLNNKGQIIDIPETRIPILKTHLNITERYRRLIPYMTYYIPSNEFVQQSPQQSGYGYASGGQSPPQRSKLPNLQHIQNHHIRHPSPAQQQQHHKRPPPINNYNPNPHQIIYKVPPQQQTNLYNTQNHHHHHHTKPYHTLSNNGNQHYDVQIQPSQQLQHKPLVVQQQSQQHIIDADNIKYQQQQSSSSNSKLTPFLPSNQIPGQFRPMLQNDPALYNEHEQSALRIENIQSTPQPFHHSQINIGGYDDDEHSDKNYLRYLQSPQNYAQFINTKSTAQQQPLHIQSHHHHHSQQPQHHQIPNNQQIIYQVKHLSAPINDLLTRDEEDYETEHDEKPHQQQQHRQQQQSHQLLIHPSPLDYTLDPDDGYDIKIPQPQQNRPRPFPIIRQYQQKFGGYKTLNIESTLSPLTFQPLTPSPPTINPTTTTTIVSSTFKSPTLSSSTSPIGQNPYYKYATNYENSYDESTTVTHSPPPLIITKSHLSHHPQHSHQQYQQQPHTTQIQPPTTVKASTFYNPYEKLPPLNPKPIYLQHQHQQNQPKSPFYQNTITKSIIKQTPQPLYPSPSSPSPPTSIPINHFTHVTKEPLPQFGSNSLSDILKKLQDANHLPKSITSDNVDESIKTLVRILMNIKQSQYVGETPVDNHHDHLVDVADNGEGNADEEQTDFNYDSDDVDDDVKSDYDNVSDDVPDKKTPALNDGTPLGPNSGRPGIDYPAFAEIPVTEFNCKEQRYKGFFGDPDTNCQVWHYCDLNGGQASFLCPNGTIFNQLTLTCDWWFNVKCATTAQLYVLNERLYKYILPFTPKFPEDYSGPLVDKYLALKFQEMEEKMKRQKLKGNKIDDADSIINKQNSIDREPHPRPIIVVDDNDDDTNQSSSSVMAATEKTDHSENIIESGGDGVEIDDDGQSHNIDNAIQYPPDAEIHHYDNQHYYSSSTPKEQLLLPTKSFTTTTTESPISHQHHHHHHHSYPTLNRQQIILNSIKKYSKTTSSPRSSSSSPLSSSLQTLDTPSLSTTVTTPQRPRLILSTTTTTKQPITFTTPQTIKQYLTTITPSTPSTFISTTTTTTTTQSPNSLYHYSTTIRPPTSQPQSQSQQHNNNNIPYNHHRQYHHPQIPSQSNENQNHLYGYGNGNGQGGGRPKVEVESEKVEVIEIQSDGSTGHLIPGHHHFIDDDRK